MIGVRFLPLCCFFLCFFFNDTATTEIYTLSLHDALPIWWRDSNGARASISIPRRRRSRQSSCENRGWLEPRGGGGGDYSIPAHPGYRRCADPVRVALPLAIPGAALWPQPALDSAAHMAQQFRPLSGLGRRGQHHAVCAAGHLRFSSGE